MHNAPLGLEVGFAAARGITRKRNANLQIGAESHIETRQERRSAAAQIFAGGFFLEGDAASIAAANFERQADGDSTFRPLSRRERADWHPGLLPPFPPHAPPPSHCYR